MSDLQLCSDLILSSCVYHLEESLLLLQVLTDHGADVVRFTVGSQFVSSSAPVLLSLILLLKALKHTAYLHPETKSLSCTVCVFF